MLILAVSVLASALSNQFERLQISVKSQGEAAALRYLTAF